MIARQVWAKAFIRDLLWLVGYPPKGVPALRKSSLTHRLPGGTHETAADAGLGLLLWVSDNCL